MSQKQSGRDSLTRSLGEVTHLQNRVVDWDFEIAVRKAPIMNARGNIRVYYKEVSSDPSSCLHFCVVKIRQIQQNVDLSGSGLELIDESDIDSVDVCELFNGDFSTNRSESNIQVNILIAGTATTDGIRRTPPMDHNGYFHGLPINEFQAVSHVLESLQSEYC